MKIYDYSDYKQYINEYIKAMPKSGRGQFQEISKAISCHSTLISQIFNGSRDLNLEQALKLCQFYNIEHRERRYFLTMVEFARAGSFELRKYYEGDLLVQKEDALSLENRLKAKEELQEHEKARFYSDSLYSMLRLMTMIPEVKSAQDLSERLNIDIVQINEILDFLISCGLIEQSSDGLKVGQSKTFISKTNPLILNHHRNWRLKAIEAQARKNNEDFFFTGPLVMGREDYLIVKDKLGEFLEEFYKIIEPSPCEELYCINLDYFKV